MLENKKNNTFEKGFRVLSDLIADPIVIADKECNIIEANEAFAKICSSKKEAIIGKNAEHLSCLSVETKKVLSENLKKRLRGDSIEPYEIEFTAKNGEIKYFELLGKKIEFHGEPMDLVILHEVTQRKQLERNLEKIVKDKTVDLSTNEITLKSVFDSSPDAITIFDLKGNIVKCNRATADLHGFSSAEEMIGKNAFDLVALKDRAKTAILMKELTKTGLKTDLEYIYLTKAGEEFPVAGSAAVIKNSGKPIGFVSVTRNIQERKETENALRKSEEKYRKLFEASMDAILVADVKTGIIVDCNPAASKLVGWQKFELVGQHQSKMTPPDQIEEGFAKGFKRHLKDQTKTLERQIMSKTGEIRDVAVKATIFELKGKKLIQGTFRDITEQKQLELEIKRLAKFPSENPNPVFRIEKNGKILFVNEAGTSILFVWNCRVGERAPNRICQVVFDALASNKKIELEETCGTKTFSFLFSPVALEGYVNVYGSDITERQIMKHALEESEEKFRSITNSVRDAIIMVDNDVKVVSWNPAAEKAFGYLKKEVVGKNIHDLIVPKTMSLHGREYIRIGVQQFAQTGSGPLTNGTVELVGQRKDGTEFPVEVSLSPIKFHGKWSAVGFVKDITERKQAEQKLKEAERRYHALFSEAPLGVLVVDPQTERIVEYNDIAHNQLGYSREEFSKLCISDFEAKEETNEINTHIAKMVRQGGDEFETKHRTKNREIRNVLVNTKAVEIADKTFLYCIFHDITEIRKVQEALMKSETQYRQLVNVAQEGIWAFDSNHHTVFVNPRIAEMLGYAESEMVGKSVFDFLDRGVVEEAKQVLSRFKQGATGNLEFVFPRKDGSRLYTSITASALKDDKGQSIGTLALVSDITERKKKALELEEEKNKFEALAQSVGAGFVVVSKDYHVLWANNFIKDYKGEIRGKLCYATLNNLGHVCPDCGVRKVFENGANSDNHEYTSIDVKGNPYCVELIATPIKDSEGNVIAAAEIAVDITEKKRLQSKLSEYSHKLEKLVEERTKQLKETQEQLVRSERLAAIGELAGMVGHDLRNPLSGIRNAAYVLKKKSGTIPEEQSKEMLEIIDKAIDYSDKIINDLLEYSREMHLELTKCKTTTLVDKAIKTIQVPDRIQIVNHVDEKTWVWANADKMMRVFINLIKNAIDAMPDSGTLTVSCCQTKDKVEIDFADTGKGIPEEILQKMFTPLFTTKAQGMGFGLAICKRIIDAHGGNIAVETEVNKGTTFKVILPSKSALDGGSEKTWVNMPESMLLPTTN